MSTLRLVATEAEVSIATASRVLNSRGAVSEDARQRVLEAANRLGYSGARRPATEYIALAYTGRTSVDSPYDMAILDGMFSAAAELGRFDIALIRLQSERKSNEPYSQMLQRKGVCGAVLRTNADTRSICHELADEGFPSLVVGDCFENGPVSYMCCDSRSTSYAAVEHLIELGHRRIAIAVSHILDHDHADRLAGYEQALRDHQIEIDPRLVHRVWAMRPNGAQLIRQLMSMPGRPTAIFIADPMIAIGAINQAHALGLKIPQDVSIIGFDDADARKNIYPVMSAICQDSRQLGYEAMMSVAESISNDQKKPIQKVWPTWLEFHETVGPPPAEPIGVLPDGTRMRMSGQVQAPNPGSEEPANSAGEQSENRAQAAHASST
jgi:DNA-binding LacI/PurR family transcriptional regulator